MAITWTSAFGRACGWLLNHIVHGLALTRISPNALTFIGLVINIVAAFLFGHANETNAGRMFFYAGLVIFSAGLFDMVDGRVARRNNRFRYVVLVAFVMVTSLMVSYTRARAEALIGQCKVGFMERPERIVLIILGALFNHWGVMAPVLWVLAVLSTITVAHRIIYTYQNTKHLAPSA
jgi:CDP-diacylglycerol--glycerol-3-phosphate 3-phosphatidyltransferase